MGNLLVFIFSNEGGADRMIADMQSMMQKQDITISDAATLIRKSDREIKVKQVNSLVGPGTLGEMFWGTLASLIFYMPWVGIAAGAVNGDLAGKFSEYGISDSFIKEVRATIGPGNSALFLMVDNMVENRVFEALSRRKAVFLRTNLSEEDVIKLHDAFRDTDMGV